MDSTILLFLLQDGLTNGAIYALLGFALVLLFTVTRIIFIPQGEFVAYGALTFAVLRSGGTPATLHLLLVFGAVALVFDVWAHRATFGLAMILRQLGYTGSETEESGAAALWQADDCEHCRRWEP